MDGMSVGTERAVFSCMCVPRAVLKRLLSDRDLEVPNQCPDGNSSDAQLTGAISSCLVPDVLALLLPIIVCALVRFRIKTIIDPLGRLQ